MAAAETTFRAMGSTWRVRAAGPAVLLDLARDRVEQLEARWSRFRDGSELCAVNRAAGRPVAVSADTTDVVSRAVDAWQVTGGRFDPTVAYAVAALGYDRSFELVTADLPAAPPPVAAPGCAAVRVDADRGTVTVPRGAALDLGGIGKGRAADLVAELLVAHGARWAGVEAGGDVRLAGDPPEPGWTVVVEDPHDPAHELARLTVRTGAVATSSTRSRTWRQGGEPRHDLVDPRTGAPAAGGLAAATVVAGEAWWAEAAAKAAVVAGVPAATHLLTTLGLPALLVGSDGSVQRTPFLDDFLAA